MSVFAHDAGASAAPRWSHPVAGAWPIAVACVAALCARLALRIDYAEEPDSIRFLLALERFDVAQFQPHFPGYPLFVLLGRAFLWLTGAPIPALATLCAVCGALLPIPVASFARATLGRREAAWAVWLAAANPLLWLHSQMLLSDIPGLLFLFAGLALLASKGSQRVALGCFLLGLTLGVRLSYFPFALSALVWLAWRKQPLARPALLMALGVAGWALPMLFMTGLDPLLEVARVQGAGHFQRWGGSVATDSDLGSRASLFAWELLAQGLGTWWSDRSWAYLVPTAGLGTIAVLAWFSAAKPKAVTLRPAQGEWRLWPLLVAPYAAWAFFGQNVALKSRHVLPLVVFLVLLVAWAITRALAHQRPPARWAAAAAALALYCGQLASGAALAIEHRDVPSTAVRASRELAAQCAANRGRPMVVYTAALERHVRREAPCAEVVEVQRLSQAKRDLARRELRPIAYVFSDVAHAERLGPEPVVRFRRNRYVQNAHSELALYRLDQPSFRLSTGKVHR